MERLFQTHYVRKQSCLDGMWDFQPVEGMELPEKYLDEIAVPSCWEMKIDYCRYRGLAVYRKKMYIKEKGNVQLLFKGVSHSGTVFWDGREAGFHYNAYTPFKILIPDAEAGEHTLEVLVDNRFTEESRLHIPNDYYTYGGVTRSVFLEQLPDCFIDNVHWKADKQGDRWMAEITVYLNNISDKTVEAEVGIDCAGKEACLQAELPPGQITEVKYFTEYEQVAEWSCETPVLYLLKTELAVAGEIIDDLIDRVGFRTVAAENGRISLNGKPVFLKGVNRHEDHGVCGCAIPVSLMDTDIKLMRDMGINAVRTSHYPNDELFLDLCDENGFLVWEESHDRGGDTERITHPLFIEQSMNVMQEMLNYHWNHPSIIIWGCLNEAASDTEAGAEVYKKHLDYLKSDDTRLNTFASNKCRMDLCLGMESVCSFNMYPYWYCDISVSEYMQEIRERLEQTHNEKKPVIVSEYGGGGIYNFHDVMRVKWSEEFQADLLERVTGELLEQKNLAGIFIWQYCDVRVSQEGERNWPMTRPLSRNNKGLVDEYRRPKQAYYAVRKLFCNGKGV